jgi:cbb3-type cytochrome oxidase subunit 3
MEVDYAIGVAVLFISTLFIAFFIFSFGTKKKSQSEETKRAAVRKRNFTPPSRTADEATIESVVARLGLVRDNGCVMTISFDLKVHSGRCIACKVHITY